MTVNAGNNNPPTGADQVATLAEDGVYTVRTSDFGVADVDLGQSLANVRIDSPPPGGALDSAPNTLSFNISAANDVPVAVADTVNGIEDQPFSGTLDGNDQLSGDGGNLFALVSGSNPSSGSIVGNSDKTFIHTLAANFTGSDSFSHTLTDADGDVSTAVVSVNVASVNDTSTAVVDTIAAVQDSPFVGSVDGNDSLSGDSAFSGDGGYAFSLVGGSGPMHDGIVFNADETFTCNSRAST